MELTIFDNIINKLRFSCCAGNHDFDHNDDMRDIANSLLENPNKIVWVKLDHDQKIVDIDTDEPYVNDIINQWFERYNDEIYATVELFEELDKYYYGNNKSVEWFENNVEYIKFSCNENGTKICGFRPFKK